MSTHPENELERLRQENRALNEQVKQLVKTERRLSLSQQALDREVHRVEILNQFSLSARRTEKPEQILCHALNLFFELFPFEQGLAFFRRDREYVVAAQKLTPGMSCRFGAHPDQIPEASIASNQVNGGPAFQNPDWLRREYPALGPFLDLFLQRQFGIEPRDAKLLACPVFIHGGKRFEGLLLLRRVTPKLSFLENLPGPEDATFIGVVAAHIAQAVENVILYTEAQSAVHVRDEFLSIASHELRTPITPLKNELQLIHLLVKRDALATYPKEQLRKLIEIADRELVRLTRLIDGMLEVTRMTSGRFTLKHEDVPVDELVAEMTSRFEPAARDAGSTLLLDLHADGAHGNWDRLRIEQVISNLITNAIRYGKGRPIRIRSRKNADAARITVEDLGIGISSENQSRLFRKFETVLANREFGGLGLGLYISRQIVEAHGGSITVASAPDKGSTFVIELPLRRPSEKAA